MFTPSVHQSHHSNVYPFSLSQFLKFQFSQTCLMSLSFFFSSNSRECNWFKSCFDLIAPLKNRPNLFENGNYKMKKSGEILRDTHFWWFPGFWLILSRTNRFGCGLWVRVVSVDCGCLWWLWVIGWGLIWLNGVASSWVAVSGFGWFTISFEFLWQPKQKLSAWYQWENRGAENS